MQSLNEIKSRNDVRIIKKIECEFQGEIKSEKSQLIIMEVEKKQKDIECVSGYVLVICVGEHDKSGECFKKMCIDLSKIGFIRKENDNLIIIGTKSNEQYKIKLNNSEKIIEAIEFYIRTAKFRLREYKENAKQYKYGLLIQKDNKTAYCWWLKDKTLYLLEDSERWGVLDEPPIKKINYADIIYYKEPYKDEIILKTKIETYEFYDVFSNFNEFMSEEINNVQGDEKEEIAAIKKYKTLLDEGIITEEEFEKKKKKIMGI